MGSSKDDLSALTGKFRLVLGGSGRNLPVWIVGWRPRGPVVHDCPVPELEEISSQIRH